MDSLSEKFSHFFKKSESSSEPKVKETITPLLLSSRSTSRGLNLSQEEIKKQYDLYQQSLKNPDAAVDGINFDLFMSNEQFVKTKNLG